MVSSTRTLCPYCGVGCGLEVSPPAQPGKSITRDGSGNPLWQVRGDRAHPSSLGQVCVKGATVAESLDRQRLKSPLMRDRLDQPLRPVTWEEAFDRMVDRIGTAHRKFGADSICMYGSGQFQTEDYYVAQKLIKGCLGTNNFDANSRLCMSSAVAGYMQNFGSDGPPCCYEDLELTDCAFLIGTNAAECHPIAFNRLHKHHKRNRHVKMIVVDPRRTKTAEAADLHLAIQPGTDVTLLNGMAHLLVQWGELDSLFIDECTHGLMEYMETLHAYPPQRVAQQCGIRVEDLEMAARLWAKASNVLSLWSMGVNQSIQGTAKVCSLINVHLLTGQLGRPGAGPFSLTGQPNAMGGREAGGLSHLLPGYRSVKNPEHRATVEQAWGLPPGRISPHPGRDTWSMITGLEEGAVQVLWIAATNPAVSLPDLGRAKAALERSPFTIYQDAYYPTETSAYAHVVLPAAQWGEKTGVMTNSERVVTLCSAFRPPVGQAKADWEIFAEVGRRLGFGPQFAFRSSAEVYREFVSLTRDRVCDMTGLSHDRLKGGPVQWPCRDSEPVVPAGDRPAQRLYTDLTFPTPDGRAYFRPFHGQGLGEPVDLDYPFVITVGRLYGHWHTQTRTGHIPKITKMHPKPFLEIHPKDAAALGVHTDDWLEVRSRRGKIRLQALVTKAIAPGVVFAPMHWGALWAEDAEANHLTHPQACPISLEPELKACAVQVVPLSSPIATSQRLDQSRKDSLLQV